MAQSAPVCDAKLIQARAPSFEHLIRKEEALLFTDPKTDQLFSFNAFRAAVAQFGCRGLTEFSKPLMGHVLNNLFGIPITTAVTNVEGGLLSREQWRILELCTSNGKSSVDEMLQVGVLFCAHQSQEVQIFELWHLANRELDSTIGSDAVAQLVTNLAQIAISRSKSILQAYKASERYQITLQSQGLEYLQAAESMIAKSVSEIRQSLPDRLNFSEFSAFVGGICMNASQLRMKISKIEESRMGSVVATSQVSTIVLGYLH